MAVIERSSPPILINGQAMIPNMPSLSIQFDINRVTSGSYGVECWKVFWSVIAPEKLPGAALYEGDITINGVDVFCLALQDVNGRLLEQLKKAFARSQDYKRICATPMFLEGPDCWGLSLPSAGRIDHAGNLTGDSWHARPALAYVKKDKRPLVSRDRENQAIAKRPTPGSSRTANLPQSNTFVDIEKHLKSKFGRPDQSFWYYLTPEELCDVLAKYSGICQGLWDQGSCGLSEDMVYFSLADKKGTRHLRFIGMFAFGSSADAVQYCRKQGIDLSMWGIQDKYALNFQGEDGVGRGDPQGDPVDADSLWTRICNRRAELGLLPGSNLTAPPAPVQGPRSDPPAASKKVTETADQYLHLTCPTCAKRIRVKKDLAGRRVRCPNKSCSASLEIPVPAAPAEHQPASEKPKWWQFWKWFQPTERSGSTRKAAKSKGPESIKFGEHPQYGRQNHCFISDESRTIRGVWVRNTADAHNQTFMIALFLKGGVSAEAIAGRVRIVPNKVTDEGGCFVMLGSFPAPGER